MPLILNAQNSLEFGIATIIAVSISRFVTSPLKVAHFTTDITNCYYIIIIFFNTVY